jgi:hypothetical protein
MKTEISTQQIGLYGEQGFVVIDDFLDADELSHWRRNVDEAIDARQDRKIAIGIRRAPVEEDLYSGTRQYRSPLPRRRCCTGISNSMGYGAEPGRRRCG